MILGVDPGERRVGLAVADDETSFARPLEVIDRTKTDAIARIGEVVHELHVELVVVGRPVGLSGVEGPAMEQQKTFLVALRAALEVDVDVFDERLTTVVAEQGMRAGGVVGQEAQGDPRRGGRPGHAAGLHRLQDGARD